MTTKEKWTLRATGLAFIIGFWITSTMVLWGPMEWATQWMGVQW